jgi:hypothetical protein
MCGDQGVRRAVRRLQRAEPTLLNKISILLNRLRWLADRYAHEPICALEPLFVLPVGTAEMKHLF